MNTINLTELLDQEKQLLFAEFDNNIAWQIGCALKQAAEKCSAKVAIEVYAFEQVLFSYAMQGTSMDNQEWIRRKRQSVMRFGHSTFFSGQYNASKKRDFESQPHIDAKEYCTHGGAFPIRLKSGGLIGVVTVSGLPQEEDHNLVVNVLRGIIYENEDT
ncbi:heme-degrading domain-containing protein [Vibrio sp. S4M6]|uniref:heme-degrading domain-containing protein n=1 Tax=Vibrio sinus TaxID=2946865 RepID=UPI00202A5DDE|nr:heme-degrading domain-containing protein [Vibrio sinus]MCL9782456.1 heme-degrading domain-containing protein [Vibrio sinus]